MVDESVDGRWDGDRPASLPSAAHLRRRFP